MDVRDTNSTEHEWGAAIEQWFGGNSDALSALVRDTDTAIPDYAREFLADLSAGNVSRGKGGRPEDRDGWLERKIVAEVFRVWETQPKDAACESVADRHNISAGAVRGLVDKLRKAGFTREAWRTWGRPDFKNR